MEGTADRTAVYFFQLCLAHRPTWCKSKVHQHQDCSAKIGCWKTLPSTQHGLALPSPPTCPITHPFLGLALLSSNCSGWLVVSVRIGPSKEWVSLQDGQDVSCTVLCSRRTDTLSVLYSKHVCDERAVHPLNFHVHFGLPSKLGLGSTIELLLAPLSSPKMTFFVP